MSARQPAHAQCYFRRHENDSRPLTSMIRAVRSAVVAVAWLATASFLLPPRDVPAGEPSLDARQRPNEYVGPGREVPEPKDVADVRIGYFGPGDPAHPDAGDLWAAAQLAVEKANAQGGYRTKPFRLVAGWSDDPWRGGAAHVARLVYKENVWAIVGGIDGASTHLAEQVAAKALLPLVSAASTDRSANSAFVPWMFSCLPGDHLQAPVLVEEIARNIGRKPLAVVSANDHDSRAFLDELLRSLKKRKIAPAYHYTCGAGAAEAAEVTARAVRAGPAAVVIVAGPRPSARLVAALRDAGFRGPVFGTSAMGRRQFLEQAGRAAEGVVFPILEEPSPRAENFREAFRRRYRRDPDFAAAATYDTVELLVAAIRKAGLNRAKIYDAIKEVAPWKGVAGTIAWDPRGSNTRPARLGTIKDGRLVPAPSGDPRPGAAPSETNTE